MMQATPLQQAVDQSNYTAGGRAALLVLAAVVLGACASYPEGPSVMVLPGSGLSFAEFRADDAGCQAYALESTGTTTDAAATRSAVTNTAVGTAIGAAAGALIGSTADAAAEGAAIGAASGLLVGSSAGAGTHSVTGARTQTRYDNAYVQCMYAHGHRVPVPAGMATSRTIDESYRPADASGPVYYPPPGTAPPPGY